MFSLSADARKEYCASVVRIGELFPIEGSDFLARTVVDGFDVVVRKDEVSTGDVMVYAENETMLHKGFLGANNLFELSERSMNSNADEVERLISEGKTDEAKRKVGFFNKHGRVKMIRLRGCPSIGFLFNKESLVKWDKRFDSVNLENYVGTEFDTVFGELFIKVYMPPVRETNNTGGGKSAKRNKPLKRFDRIIPGMFSFHYDTDQLNKNVWKINPDDKICVSVKLHGTSGIFGNVKIRKPIVLNAAQKVLNRSLRKTAKRRGDARFLRHQAKDFIVGYGNVYSSRTVIKNKYINKDVKGGFYGTDVWAEINDIIRPHLSAGMTVYGEIVGYVGGTSKMIQKQYDYGCESGVNKIMPYRITVDREDGSKTEWNVTDVAKWTVATAKKDKTFAERSLVIPILYHGKAKDMYPDIPVDKDWHERFLAAMKTDGERLLMERNEPMCKNKVPREGVCVRIDNDKVAECFKLKCDAYRMKEQKDIDAGIVDIETEQSYGEGK